VAALGLLLVLILTLPGCQSDAAIAFRGARHYSAGNRALDRGDGALAVRELRLAAELLPRASEIQNHLGLAYLAQNEEARALEAFRRAVELDCDNQAARINLARTARERDDLGGEVDRRTDPRADRSSSRTGDAIEETVAERPPGARRSDPNGGG
jgi:tetratricopeptide (TPR) repeat protein